MNNIKNHKIVLLGDSFVGKTSFAQRIKENIFIDKQDSTIGCEFFTCIFDIPGKKDKKIKLLIWDTSGQEIFKHFTSQFTRNTSLALIFFDINCIKTRNNIKNYIEEWTKYIQENTIVLVITTKNDLFEGKYDIDLYDIVTKFKNETHIAQPISSKNSIGIDIIKDQIIRILENKVSNLKETISIDINNSDKNEICCSI